MVRRVMTLTVLLTVAAGGVEMASDESDASRGKRRADICVKGTVPLLVRKGRRMVARRDRRGRVRCSRQRVIPPARPASSSRGQLGRVADSITSGLKVDPAVVTSLERRVGRRRAARLIDLALRSWRLRAGAAALRARSSKRDSFDISDGVKATVDYGSREITGDKLGVAAEAIAELTVTREGLEKSGEGVKDKLPKSFLGAAAKVTLSFEDAPAACPTAAGRVPGRLHAKGTLTISIKTTSGVFTIKALVEVEARYTATVADNARWKGLSDVDVQTTFQLSATGSATRTYRGRVASASFGRDSWFGGSKEAAQRAVERDFGSATNWRISGPKGSWDLKKGVSLQDLRSLENIKSMAAANYATMIATIGAVEYLRRIAMPRQEKHWYDQEACLALDASAAATKLAPKATTIVTARNARARSGTAVPASLTATGSASIAPGAGALAVAASKGFTLTAPEKGSATWRILVLSRAGKKTVAGQVPVESGPVALRITGYSESLRSDTAHGWRQRTDTLKSASPPALPMSCDEYDDAECGRKYEIEARVTTTIDGAVSGPQPMCAFTYPTYQEENPGTLLVIFDPAGGGPATIRQTVPLASVGDVYANTCGANTTSRENVPVETTAARADVLSGRAFTVTLHSTGTLATDPFSADATIQHAWTKKVTLQRVEPDGSAYP